MRRYFGLLVCLAVSTIAHAYNEEIVSVAYNPSRVGAYNYLKTNQATFKSGLRAVGNTASEGSGYSTEVNLIGDVSIIDNNAGNHKTPSNVDALNTLTNIKPVSNYALDSTGRTFCSTGNDRACAGTTGLEAKALRGLGSSLDDYAGTGADPALIPNVYMYGGNIERLTDNELYSRVKAIKRMYMSGPTLQETSEFPSDFIWNTRDLVGRVSNVLHVTEQLTFGDMNIAIPTGFANCTNSKYFWKERITDKHVKVKILACN